MDRGYDTRSPIQKKSSLPRTFTLFRVYIFFVLFFLSVGVLLTMTHAPLLKIRNIAVYGGQITPNENIHAYIAKGLEGGWGVVFPFDNIVSVPITTLTKNIRNTFASVSSVHIQRVGFSQIEVSIVERTPTQMYCKEGSCVLVDREGIVFAPAPTQDTFEVIDGNIAEFIRRSSAVEVYSLGLGKSLLPSPSRAHVEKVRSFLIDQGFVIKKIHLAPLGFFDIDAEHKESHAKVEFRFRDTKKIDEQMGELYLALEKGLRQKIHDGRVEYVISYVPQKVIYKNIK